MYQKVVGRFQFYDAINVAHDSVTAVGWIRIPNLISACYLATLAAALLDVVACMLVIVTSADGH